MEKVYLLLRNNKESGPYTIDELLGQQLKPADLIWVEGRSLAWAYPSEIKELSGGSKTRQRATQKKKETEKDDIEIKAEELRQRILSYKPQYHLQGYTNKISEPAAVLPVQNIDIVYKTTRKSNHKYVSLSHLLATAVATTVILAMWYGDWSPVKTNVNTADVVAKPLITVEANAAFAPKDNFSDTIQKISLATIPGDSAIAQPKKITRSQPIPIAKTDSIVAEIKNEEPKTSREEIKTVENIPIQKAEVKEAPASSKAATSDIENAITTSTETIEKRKTLGQAIKGLFAKKKKEKTTDTLNTKN